MDPTIYNGHCNPLLTVRYFLDTKNLFLVESIYYDIIFPFQVSELRNRIFLLLKTGQIFTRNVRLDMTFTMLLRHTMVW